MQKTTLRWKKNPLEKQNVNAARNTGSHAAKVEMDLKGMKVGHNTVLSRK